MLILEWSGITATNPNWPKAVPGTATGGETLVKYRSRLPQLSGDLFLSDGGVETDLIFNHGIEIRGFAAHTLLSDGKGREALENYFRGFLRLARDTGAGFILDSQTWKAHMHWADELDTNATELRTVN